ELRQRRAEIKNAVGDRPGDDRPVSQQQRNERVNRVAEKSEAADAVGMRRDQPELDARHLTEKAYPDEYTKVPAHEEELVNRQAHVGVPNARGRKLQTVGRRRRVPCRGGEREVVAPEHQYADDIDESDQEDLG